MLRARYLCAIAAMAASVGSAHAQITTERIAVGFDRPLSMVADPLDPTVFFVVEQAGLVRVVRDRQVLPTPFLDLRSVVSSDGERGLLGLAFEPAAPAPGLPDDRAIPRVADRVHPSGAPIVPQVPRFTPAPTTIAVARVFVNFTNRDGHTVVARFRRRGDNPLVADPTSRRDLVWPDGRAFIEQPFSNHNGGHLLFGPDGFLYIGLGDGGSAGDPAHRAQTPTTLLGKMLRLDVSVADSDPRGYRIPADNPFVDNVPVAALHEIWSFGLRNPWRYSFDDPARGGTGTLWIGDVGQGAREEIDVQPAGTGGLNYGWRLREGSLTFDERLPAAYMPLTAPVLEYGRAEGQSVTGGYVYRGSALDRSLVGRYFYADFVSGRVFSASVGGSAGAPTVSDLREHTAALGGRAQLGNVSSFGVDSSGELYIVNHSAGAVLKIIPQLALVPAAPKLIRVEYGSGHATVEWQPGDGGTDARAFIVEVAADIDTPAVQRVEVGRVAPTKVPLGAGRCVRVRGVGTGGEGPPSSAVCRVLP